MRQKQLHISLYILSDIIAAAIVWTCIALQRKYLLNEEPKTLTGFLHKTIFSR